MREILENERRLWSHHVMWGSAAYPVRRLRPGRWVVDRVFGVNGPPVVFKTKREAVAAHEAYLTILGDLIRAEAVARAAA